MLVIDNDRSFRTGEAGRDRSGCRQRRGADKECPACASRDRCIGTLTWRRRGMRLAQRREFQRACTRKQRGRAERDRWHRLEKRGILHKSRWKSMPRRGPQEPTGSPDVRGSGCLMGMTGGGSLWQGTRLTRCSAGTAQAALYLRFATSHPQIARVRRMRIADGPSPP